MVDPVTRTLFASFFQVGLLAFGGGFASVALLQHVIVDQMQWLTFAQFRDGIALGQITPGPVLITATFTGFRVGGVLGSLAATVGIFLPPIILTMLLADLHARLARLPIVRAIVTGLQYGFVGLVAAITLRFGLGSLGSWQTWAIFVLGAGYLNFSKRSPGWAILATIAFSLVFVHA
jgi:chromate transporter